MLKYQLALGTIPCSCIDTFQEQSAQGDSVNAAYKQPVFVLSVLIIAVLVFIGAVAPRQFGEIAQAGLEWATTRFGWFFLMSVFGFVVVLVYLAFSKYGETKLALRIASRSSRTTPGSPCYWLPDLVSVWFFMAWPNR